MVLTNEQINNIADNCKCGYFQYGDAQGRLRLIFARAVEAACQDANDVDLPILRIINDYLRNGASIEVRDDKVCLIRADGEILVDGESLVKFFENCIWTLC